MEEREPDDGMVSNRDSAIAAAICSLLVAIITWAVLAGPFQNVIVDNGNVADWIAAIAGLIAAIGTWVIGVGANRYAAENHRARGEQLRSELDGRLAVLLNGATQLSGIYPLVASFEAESEETYFPDLQRLEVLITFVERSVQDAAPDVTRSLIYFPRFTAAIGGIQILSKNIVLTINIIRFDIGRSENPRKTQDDAIRNLGWQTLELQRVAQYLVDATAAMSIELNSDIANRWRDEFGHR